jgi:hypothetical protein
MKYLIFVKFHVPVVMKIEVSDFWEVLCSRGHEDWRKLKYLIFGKFHLPGVMKIEVSDFWEVLHIRGLIS